MLGSLVLLTLLPLQQNQPTPPTEAEIQDAMAFGMKIAQWQNLPMTSFRHQGEDFFSQFPNQWTVLFSNGSVSIAEKSRKVIKISFSGLSTKRLLQAISLESATTRVTNLCAFLFPGKPVTISQGSSNSRSYHYVVSYLKNGFAVSNQYQGYISYDFQYGFVREVMLPTEPASYGDAIVRVNPNQIKQIAIAKAKLRKPGDYFCQLDPTLCYELVETDSIKSIVSADWRTQQDLEEAESNKAILVYRIGVTRRPDENGRGAATLFYVIEAKTGRVLYETK